MKSHPFLSKSKYLSGLQCYKLLWHYYNAKEEIAEVDVATQAIFDQGHLVGEYAKKLFPIGIEVAEGVVDFGKVIEQSQQLISKRLPLFEAAFQYKNGFARADILNPVGKDSWDIVEVKSSTEVKDINVHDVTLQRYVYEGAGLRIRKCWIYCINNQYIRKGDIEPDKFFSKKEVTKEVDKLLPSVENKLRKMVDIIQLAKYPDINIGPQCSDPFECPLIENCWSFLPKHNVFTLTRIGKKGFKLLEEGISNIKDIPKNYRLTDKQMIQAEAIHSRKPAIYKQNIQNFLKKLKYPLYFLDFETFMTAIPVYDDVRPYQSIPFQYSLHILKAQDEKPEHHSFLADGKKDPRPEILKLLKKLLGNSGSIIAYNAGFEKGKLADASAAFSEYRDWFENIQNRIVDLLSPFRSFDYYHPEQMGTASIKAVLPALTGKSYEGMEIAEGGTASIEYLRVTFNDVTEKDRQHVREQLEKYCSLDTLAMVWIVEKLNKLVK
ncbi:MAG: DUF2779 domain-containing protein [Bacteroidota bacterium]|jgi:hypothetical protein